MAAGAVDPHGGRVATAVAAVACVPLSLACGPPAGAAHLVAVAAGLGLRPRAEVEPALGAALRRVLRAAAGVRRARAARRAGAAVVAADGGRACWAPAPTSPTCCPISTTTRRPACAACRTGSARTGSRRRGRAAAARGHRGAGRRRAGARLRSRWPCRCWLRWCSPSGSTRAGGRVRGRRSARCCWWPGSRSCCCWPRAPPWSVTRSGQRRPARCARIRARAAGGTVPRPRPSRTAASKTRRCAGRRDGGVQEAGPRGQPGHRGDVPVVPAERAAHRRPVHRARARRRAAPPARPARRRRPRRRSPRRSAG